ncbi:helix-turn-helix domain-containing protein [Harryflintia acetispora]|uniref:Transcriptional regulator n=1 Tax=Harryflintia acetispora TaxID=1849041 RepID=A0A9X8UJH6_9FIRM|nr:helix-turn-helix transcriptional regulator [Harryflintia acetispora]TCL43013.1 putative transcriptional regulator [Harryflintia acetispora]
MQDREYGYIKIKLEKVIRESGLSKNKVSHFSEMQRTQLNTYCKGELQRVDLVVLARICHTLSCKVQDVLEYVPPQG